jgi:hypothetical protein
MIFGHKNTEHASNFSLRSWHLQQTENMFVLYLLLNCKRENDKHET